MKKLKALTIALLFVMSLTAQTSTSVWTVDFVKIKENKREESLFYYENNWKIYRDTALARGIIKSYKMLEVQSDTASGYNLMLMTEYANSEMRQKSEQNFAPLLKEVRPNGPVLKNDYKPNEFRQNLFFVDGNVIFENSNSPKKALKKPKHKAKKK